MCFVILHYGRQLQASWPHAFTVPRGQEVFLPDRLPALGDCSAGRLAPSCARYVQVRSNGVVDPSIEIIWILVVIEVYIFP